MTKIDNLVHVLHFLNLSVKTKCEEKYVPKNINFPLI